MEENKTVLLPPSLRNIIRFRNLLNPVVFALITGVGLNFFRFLRGLGISAEKNLVVLSSKDHYFFGEEDLRNAGLLINLRRLNLIKHLDIFLRALVLILPPDTGFAGYFADKNPEGGFYSQFKNFFRFSTIQFGLNESATNHIMSRNEVVDLLEKNGFRTIIMKEINGLTYFFSSNIGAPDTLNN